MENASASLQELLVALWGRDARIVTDKTPDGSSPAIKYGVVPSRARPRFVIPLADRRVTSAALQRYPSSKWHIRRIRGVASAVARTGLGPRLFRDHVVVDESSARPLVAALERTLRTRGVSFAISVDLDRPHRKPTLLIFSARGGIAAFGKVGWNDLTRPLVRHEAGVLERLAASAAPRSFDVPELLGTARHGDLEIMLVGPLGGRRGPGRPPRNLPVLATAELARLLPVRESALCESDYWRELRGRADAHREDSFLAAALALVEAEWGSLRLEFGLAHGDWVPWNMGIRRNLSVWDWERGSFQSPVGSDAVHFIFQVALHWERRDPQEAARVAVTRAEQEFDQLSLSRATVKPLLLLNNVEMCLRFAEARSRNISADRTKYELAWEELAGRSRLRVEASR